MVPPHLEHWRWIKVWIWEGNVALHVVSSAQAADKLYSERSKMRFALENKSSANPLLHETFVFNLTKYMTALNQNCVA